MQKSLSRVSVDFSSGILLAEEEVLVNSVAFPNSNAVIHYSKVRSAHHDIILPAKREDVALKIAVSCKASFRLSHDAVIQQQLRVSKTECASGSIDMAIFRKRKQGKEIF